MRVRLPSTVAASLARSTVGHVAAAHGHVTTAHERTASCARPRLRARGNVVSQRGRVSARGGARRAHRQKRISHGVADRRRVAAVRRRCRRDASSAACKLRRAAAACAAAARPEFKAAPRGKANVEPLGRAIASCHSVEPPRPRGRRDDLARRSRPRKREAAREPRRNPHAPTHTHTRIRTHTRVAVPARSRHGVRLLARALHAVPRLQRQASCVAPPRPRPPRQAPSRPELGRRETPPRDAPAKLPHTHTRPRSGAATAAPWPRFECQPRTRLPSVPLPLCPRSPAPSRARMEGMRERAR